MWHSNLVESLEDKCTVEAVRFVANELHGVGYDNMNLCTSIFVEQRGPSGPTKVTSGAFGLLSGLRNAKWEHMLIAPIMKRFKASTVLQFNQDISPSLAQLITFHDQLVVTIIDSLFTHQKAFEQVSKHSSLRHTPIRTISVGYKTRKFGPFYTLIAAASTRSGAFPPVRCLLAPSTRTHNIRDSQGRRFGCASGCSFAPVRAQPPQRHTQTTWMLAEHAEPLLRMDLILHGGELGSHTEQWIPLQLGAEHLESVVLACLMTTTSQSTGAAPLLYPTPLLPVPAPLRCAAECAPSDGGSRFALHQQQDTACPRCPQGARGASPRSCALGPESHEVVLKKPGTRKSRSFREAPRSICEGPAVHERAAGDDKLFYRQRDGQGESDASAAN
ncbi:hypothetical protein B0H13DRAFT_2501943 [Mycena leptocephala]|nr:hypothetical protein B0H13DRAFT_2501943 [Mycena leptocephala]